MIRPLIPDDVQAALDLVGGSGLFSPGDRAEIKIRLDEYLRNSSGDLFLIHAGPALEGLLYCAAEPMTNGTWNILMLLVAGSSQGQGVGAALVGEVQKLLAERKARLLMVETSGTDGFQGAQRFYRKCGFAEVARIPDFYDAGDDKIIFTMSMRF